MSNTVIKIEHLSKQYRLGKVGTGFLAHDINRFWHTIRGKEDPYLRIGDTNDRSVTGDSEYVWSLRDIDLEIQQGDAFGIIGKNGAGKSTLLKILSRTTAPTTGKVKIKGRVASLLEVGTGFHPELSGRENIFLNGAILGMTKSEIRRKFDEIVDFAGVQRYVDTPVKRYSSGMYVRLAFAVAAYLESEILIVDEVLAVGDAEFQKKCLGKMGEVSKGQGRTVLFVSHNLSSVQQLCTKGVVLKNGKLEYQGYIEDACQFYRQSMDATYDERSHFKKEASQSDEISIIESYISDLGGNCVGQFDFDEDIFLIIRYKVNKAVIGSVVNFIVSDNFQELLMSFDTDENVDDFLERGEGIYETRVCIPRNRLKPGLYNVSVGVGIANNRAIEQIDKCLSFEVYTERKNYLHASFYKTRRGVVPLLAKWETSKIN